MPSTWTATSTSLMAGSGAIVSVPQLRPGWPRQVLSLTQPVLDVGARQISLLRLDHKLTELPYISEVYTLCVPPGGPGTEGGNQLGVLVRFKDPSGSKSHSDAAGLYADDFRAQLSEALRPAEIAVAVRVLSDGEEIPRTFNMKPFRRLAVKQFFPSQFLPLQENAAAAC